MLYRSANVKSVEIGRGKMQACGVWLEEENLAVMCWVRGSYPTIGPEGRTFQDAWFLEFVIPT
jgi:hypothetical protein